MNKTIWLVLGLICSMLVISGCNLNQEPIIIPGNVLTELNETNFTSNITNMIFNDTILNETINLTNETYNDTIDINSTNVAIVSLSIISNKTNITS